MLPFISETLDSVAGALMATAADLQQAVIALQPTIKKKDDVILTFRLQANDLRAHNDDLKPLSCRASVRVFGVQGTYLTPQTTN